MSVGGLRHSITRTTVTWGVQARMDLWERSGCIVMTVEMIESRCGHTSTNHMEDACAVFDGQRRKRAAWKVPDPMTDRIDWSLFAPISGRASGRRFAL